MKLLIFQPIYSGNKAQNTIDDILKLKIPSDVQIDLFCAIFDPTSNIWQNLTENGIN